MQKSILSKFEVLNIENNDFEWDSDLIPDTKESRSRHPSIGIYDDRLLFVCGGRGVCAMNSCEVLNISNMSADLKWKRISCMNYARSFGSNMIGWNKYNCMLLMGGYGSMHSEYYAEKYDINKDKWMVFKSNFQHKYNPYIKLTKNSKDCESDLLIVICDKRTKGNLGIIEILDIRMNKWMKCKMSADELLQFDKKQELRRLLY